MCIENLGWLMPDGHKCKLLCEAQSACYTCWLSSMHGDCLQLTLTGSQCNRHTIMLVLYCVTGSRAIGTGQAMALPVLATQFLKK